MKTPFIIALAIVLGIIATNVLIPKKTDLASDAVIEDSIGTAQAAPKQVDGNHPL